MSASTVSFAFVSPHGRITQYEREAGGYIKCYKVTGDEGNEPDARVETPTAEALYRSGAYAGGISKFYQSVLNIITK